MDDQQPFNFPILIPAHKKSRELFIDYGPCAAINSLDGETIISQKGSFKDAMNYAACHPVLPLHNSCSTGIFPLILHFYIT